MDVIERQAQGISLRKAPDSTVRQSGAAGVRVVQPPAGGGGDALRHDRDVLADFLQYDAKR